MLRVLSDIGDAAQFAAAIGIIVFFIQYTVLAKWWKNPFGRTIIGLDFCLLGVLGPSIYALIEPVDGAKFFASSGYAYLETIILVVAAVIIGSRVFLWEKLRRARDIPDDRSSSG